MTGTVLTPITRFTGEHGFLSNFSPDPVELPWLQGIIFPTAEHAFQALKTNALSDIMLIQGASTPARAKQYGRKLTLRPDWDQVKRRMMMEVLLAKFGASTQLTRMLAGTGHRMLVEGNTWGDWYWGAIPVSHLKTSPGLNRELVHAPFWYPDFEEKPGTQLAGWILMMVREIVP